MSDSLRIELQKGDRSFPFELHRRTITLGVAGPIAYHWMDSRQFRRKRPGPNFRACVDSWWADVERAGDAGLEENLINLVLAESFPLVSTARSLQDIYLDAHLHPKADREFIVGSDGRRAGPARRIDSLPPDETRRLRELAHMRDAEAVGAEFDRLFLAQLPPEGEMPAYQEACRDWVGRGIAALVRGGRDGLRAWIRSELATRLKKLRRRGGQDPTRQFINMFSYECKVSFYSCYANAWLGLIPRLVADGHLDTIGERFHHLWHYQNPTIEDPTLPTGGRRDAFCGQVLALHPLSGVALVEPDHLQAIGGWIGHPDHEELVRLGRDGSCPAYWEMVATVMIAAHEYRRSHALWDDRRGVRTVGVDSCPGGPPGDDAPPAVGVTFEDFARDRGHACASCGGPLAYVRHDDPVGAAREVRVHFLCRGGGHEAVVEVGEQALADFLSDSSTD
jgi:hypothetical protein